MKLNTQTRNVVSAEDKFSAGTDCSDASHTVQAKAPENLAQLGELAVRLLQDKNLAVSGVRPFFWTLVETYIDRFHVFPFDVNKALFSELELKNYPEKDLLALVKKLELQFEQAHGRPLLKSTQLLCEQDALDDEVRALRDSLKYAAVVSDEAFEDV